MLPLVINYYYPKVWFRAKDSHSIDVPTVTVGEYERALMRGGFVVYGLWFVVSITLSACGLIPQCSSPKTETRLRYECLWSLYD